MVVVFVVAAVVTVVVVVVVVARDRVFGVLVLVSVVPLDAVVTLVFVVVVGGGGGCQLCKHFPCHLTVVAGDNPFLQILD